MSIVLAIPSDETSRATRGHASHSAEDEQVGQTLALDVDSMLDRLSRPRASTLATTALTWLHVVDEEDRLGDPLARGWPGSRKNRSAAARRGRTRSVLARKLAPGFFFLGLSVISRKIPTIR